jgi:Uma2 family endonuclease
MTNAPAPALMTAEELLRLPDDGNVYELDRGKLIRMSPSASWANTIAAEILTLLNTFVRRHKLGRCGGGEGGFILDSDPDIVRAPDVWFVQADRLEGGRPPNTYFRGAPDLAVEVISPTDRPGAVTKKVGEYLEAGTRLVWVVYPESRSAVIHRPKGMPEIIGEDGLLDGEDVVPGFTLPLQDALAD